MRRTSSFANHADAVVFTVPVTAPPPTPTFVGRLAETGSDGRVPITLGAVLAAGVVPRTSGAAVRG